MLGLGRIGDLIDGLNLDIMAIRVGTAGYIAKETVAVNTKYASCVAAHKVDQGVTKVKEEAKEVAGKVKATVDTMKKDMQEKKEAKAKAKEKAETENKNESSEENRHRHRYEFNNSYREEIEKAGMRISGTSPDNMLVETVEVETVEPENESGFQDLQRGVIYGPDFSDLIIKEEVKPEPAAVEPEVVQEPIVETEASEPKVFTRETPSSKKEVTVRDIEKLVREDAQQQIKGKKKKR